MKNQKIIKICVEKFIYLNYSPRTKDNYIHHIKEFINSIGEKQIIHCNSQDYRNIHSCIEPDFKQSKFANIIWKLKK